MTFQYRHGGPLELHYRDGMKFTYEKYERFNSRGTAVPHRAESDVVRFNLGYDVYNNLTVIESDNPKIKVGEVIEQITIHPETDEIWYEKNDGTKHEFQVDKLERRRIIKEQRRIIKEQRRIIKEQRRIIKEFEIAKKRALRCNDEYHSSNYDVSSSSSESKLDESDSDQW